MPQSHQSKFAESYKRRSGGIDKRALRGLRRSQDWKQSRSEVVGQRRNIMESTAMSPVTESRSKAASTNSGSQQPTSGSSKAGKHLICTLRTYDRWRGDLMSISQ